MKPTYPVAERLELIEAIHGHQVPDPYRWLEDDRSAQTHEWNAAQDALVRPFLDPLPGRDRLRRRLRELVVGWVGLPHHRGQRVFWSRREPSQELGVLYVRDGDGTERILVDPNILSDDHTVTLDNWWPSDDGDLLAYVLSKGGDEETTLYIADVSTGELVDTPIDRTRAGSFAWMPDGKSYYFVRRLPPEDVPPGEQEYHRRVWRRRIGSDSSSNELVFGEGRDKIEFYVVDVSRDGRWLVVHATKGNARMNDLYIADLLGDGKLRPVVEGEPFSTFGYIAEDDGLLYLQTNLGAPNWRYVIADPAHPSPDGWRNIIPESDAVLVGALLTKDAIVTLHTIDVTSRLTVHDRATGMLRTDVPAPGSGTIGAMTSTQDKATRDEVWFAYTDFVTPVRIYHYRVSTGELDLWASPPGETSRPSMVVRQVFYKSRDGTRVPMFVMHRDGLDLDRKRPTILYGYGGWAIPQVPVYSGAHVAWVERGGVYAIANIRGGSEYGEAWHRAGMRETKQNVFDDFIAAAEWLCAEGFTRPDHLGIFGGSNGGILVGACVTQRPDLFASAVCSAPVLDMVRFPHMPSGQISVGELGDPSIPEEFEYLYAYSPYHRVREGVPYPAVLFTVFESDARVAPWHARKMCAAMQHATASNRPILYRREEEVGHAGRSLTRWIELSVDTLSFHAAMLGLDLSS